MGGTGKGFAESYNGDRCLDEHVNIDRTRELLPKGS